MPYLAKTTKSPFCISLPFSFGSSRSHHPGRMMFQFSSPGSQSTISVQHYLDAITTRTAGKILDFTWHSIMTEHSKHNIPCFLEGNVAFKRINLNDLEYKEVERIKAVFLSLLRPVSLLCKASQKCSDCLNSNSKAKSKNYSCENTPTHAKFIYTFQEGHRKFGLRSNEARARFFFLWNKIFNVLRTSNTFWNLPLPH